MWLDTPCYKLDFSLGGDTWDNWLDIINQGMVFGDESIGHWKRENEYWVIIGHKNEQAIWIEMNLDIDGHLRTTFFDHFDHPSVDLSLIWFGLFKLPRLVVSVYFRSEYSAVSTRHHQVAQDIIDIEFGRWERMTEWRGSTPKMKNIKAKRSLRKVALKTYSR